LLTYEVYNIVFFSGLGADKRVFERLQLKNINPYYIEWELPEINQSLSEYAEQITKQIPFKNPIFVGVSFGGIIALECSRFLHPEKVILISSIKHEDELPKFYKLFKHPLWTSVLPAKSLIHLDKLNAFLFGVSKFEDKKLLDIIIHDTHPDFLKWAIFQVLNWKATHTLKKIIHIHGNADKILPLPKTGVTHIVNNGGHFMIVTHAQQIVQLLNNEISNC